MQQPPHMSSELTRCLSRGRRRAQENLIRFLTAGCGRAFPPEVARAAMLVRVVTNARGGHGAIRELFQEFQQLISFSQHMVMNPIMEFDGNQAKVTWYFLGPFTFRKENAAKWTAVRYEDDYVKVNGEWKFKHLRAFIRMHAPHATGWAPQE